MASVLTGALAKTIAAAFKGRLVKGTLRRETPITLDTGGNPATKSITTYGFEGIREDFSAFYRQQAGIPETDCKILLIAGLIKPPTDPRKDDLIQIPRSTGPWFRVRKMLSVDPATASYSVQAFQVQAP